MYGIKHKQVCIISLKYSRHSRKFINMITTASFLNGFKISDIGQLILALIFRFGVILI